MKGIKFEKGDLDFLTRKPLEQSIDEYKFFYKKYFLNIKNYDVALEDLLKSKQLINDLPPKIYIGNNTEYYAVESKVSEILIKHFPIDINELFNKLIKVPIKEGKINRNFEDDLFYRILSAFTNTFEQTTESYKREIEYKRNFINFLFDCLLHFGLHPKIAMRDSSIYKRYNIEVSHHFKSVNIQIERKLLINSIYLNNEILKPFKHRKPIMINGMLIPFNKVIRIKITSTLLQNDELDLFAFKHKLNIHNSDEYNVKFIELCIDETDKLLSNPYLEEIMENQIFIDLNRIKELKNIKSSEFDLIKLIRLCEELNSVYVNNNYMTSSLALRAIIDHIPPIFNFKDFNQFANNYSGGTKSLKKSMLKLNESLRNIADNHIHSQVRNKEVLPNKTQVNFSQELDLLLSEIVRVLK